jgi:hypothetical protein
MSIMTLHSQLTMARVEPGVTGGVAPEFGRIKDVERLFGIKRGTAYSLLATGKIRGCVLRVRGKQSGVRLIDLASVRDYIRSAMQEADEARGRFCDETIQNEVTRN